MCLKKRRGSHSSRGSSFAALKARHRHCSHGYHCFRARDCTHGSAPHCCGKGALTGPPLIDDDAGWACRRASAGLTGTGWGVGWTGRGRGAVGGCTGRSVHSWVQGWGLCCCCCCKVNTICTSWFLTWAASPILRSCTMLDHDYRVFCPNCNLSK